MFLLHFYWPPSKLREGKIVIGVCPSWILPGEGRQGAEQMSLPCPCPMSYLGIGQLGGRISGDRAGDSGMGYPGGLGICEIGYPGVGYPGGYIPHPSSSRVGFVSCMEFFQDWRLYFAWSLSAKKLKLAPRNTLIGKLRFTARSMTINLKSSLLSLNQHHG